jgi:Ca2+-binding RTX toxin-like protein
MGGNGNDNMDGGAGNDTLSGQGGFDTADYRSAASAIRLTLDKVANDGRVAIGEKDNVLDAEQLLGGIYNDTITGDAGFNQIYGGAGNDEIHAGGGNDDVHGGPGSDKLYGGDGNDTLKGDDGNDLLGGENGNDSLDGGLGADGIFGNAGDDTADYSARTANLSIIQDGIANDGQAGETDNLASDVETIKGGSGNDLIKANADLNYYNAFYGNGGNDTLDGGPGIDTLDGGAGNDRLISGSDYEVFYVFEPTPPGHADSFPADLMLGGAGDDWLVPGTGDDIMYGGAGNDTVDYSHYGSRTGIDVSLDGKRNDGYRAWTGYFLGVGDVSYSEADNVEADVENVIGTYNFDRLVGNDAANHLIGGAGNDTLIGGGGNDTLDGAGSPIPEFDTDNDVLDGGAGDDLLLSRDAYQDTLDGGLGYDRAQVDSSDLRSNIELLLA